MSFTFAIITVQLRNEAKMELTIKKLLAFLVFSQILSIVLGHGMCINPVNRASRWRYDRTAPTNYDDNGLNCGGYSTQHNRNGGKCGICGDSYSLSRPRPHELGGKYGQGVIVKGYPSGSKINVDISITANHRGYFWFDLCNMDKLKRNRATMEEEECFDTKILTADGNEKWYLTSTSAKVYTVGLQLPEVTCEHCIFRWTYVVGNSWGFCPNGTGMLGCGPQENFRTCSDIQLYSSRYAGKTFGINLPEDAPEPADNTI